MVTETRGQWRVTIPKEMIKDKGWLNVRYIRIDDTWGDRIVITRVADHEESETKDK